MEIEEIIRLGVPDMTESEILRYFPYEEPIGKQVLVSMLGLLIPECRLPWVENIFVPGHPCYEAYHNMHAAYGRLRNKLNVEDEDPDAELMINSLLEYSDIIALKMFEYGRLYEQRRK